MITINPVWHNSQAEVSARLRQLAEEWAEARVVAVDTEFIRMTTFFPIPALLQIGDEHQQDLLPAEFIDKNDLHAFFDKTQQCEYVVHAASEDIEVFDLTAGIIPVQLIDTQIAAGMAGLPPSMGLQRLIHELLGIELEKTQSLTDWLQRPLTNSQISYAAEDIAYLPAVYAKLKAQLEDLGRWQWVQEECRNRLCISDNRPEDYYLRYANAWRLTPAQLFVFKHVTTWRENYAREHNIARVRIVRDNIVFEAIVKNAKNRRDLEAIGMHPSAVRKYGDKLLDQLYACQYSDEDLARVERPLGKPEQKIMKAMRKIVVQEAEKLGVDPQVLASKKMCMALLRWCIQTESQTESQASELPVLFSGWRQAIITQPCIELVRAMRSSA